MQSRRPIQRLTRALAVSVITVAAVAGAPAAGAPAAAIPAAGVTPCVAWTSGQQPPDPAGTTHDNAHRGVAVLSPCNVWAVGEYAPELTLIVHWDGRSWTQVPSPNPGIEARLWAVHALSASNVWAVGEYFDGTTDKTLLVHWDGTAWKQVKSPNPGGATQNNDLDSIAVTSANDAWVAGEYGSTAPIRTLVLHWDGSAWRQVTAPSLGGPVIDDTLTGVRASSAGNVWVVGHYYNGTAEQTLALHCC
jgi:hypothetical protein